MASLQYYAYKGVGEQNRRDFWYSQAVRIPAGADRIECAGQGGWNPDNMEMSADVSEQIDQAFANVDLCLKDAGAAKGWASVFRVNSYHIHKDQTSTGIDSVAMDAMVRNFKKWCPEHHPTWTCIGVPSLGSARMQVEIEVVGYDEK